MMVVMLAGCSRPCHPRAGVDACQSAVVTVSETSPEALGLDDQQAAMVIPALSERKAAAAPEAGNPQLALLAQFAYTSCTFETDIHTIEYEFFG